MHQVQGGLDNLLGLRQIAVDLLNIVDGRAGKHRRPEGHGAIAGVGPLRLSGQLEQGPAIVVPGILDRDDGIPAAARDLDGLDLKIWTHKRLMELTARSR
jgi:hypothetical protein